MSGDVAKAALKLSMWLITVSALLMFVVERGTPAFYINIFSFLLGILLLGVIALVVRLVSRSQGD